MQWVLYLAVAVSAHAAGEEFFETRIRPLLAARCQTCHGANAASGLRLDSREAALLGGKRGPAIRPGDASGSLLLQAVMRVGGAPKMPPDGPIAEAEITALRSWIEAGAVWPARAPGPAKGAPLWSAAPLPERRGSVDTHVRAALAAKGIPQAPRAAPRTILRRLSIALTGVPPTPAEMDAFLKDRAPDSMPRLVDRLLASPRFGERWARHWLDVARYGEVDFSGTEPKFYPNAWRYRDWVIQAMNRDLPYDDFVRAQLAADLLPGAPADLLGGLGFLGLGPWYYGITQPPQARADERHDRVDVVSRGFLGLTAACARCHDHKYDPIPQTDYYALAGVFASTEYKEYPLAAKAAVDAYEAAQSRIRALEKEIDQFLANQRDQLALIFARQAAAYLLEEPGLDAGIATQWKAYLKQPEEDHPFLKPWQAAATPEARKAAAAGFQQALLATIEEKRAIDESNRQAVIRGVDFSGKRRKIILPFRYDSEADFNPGADVPTKSLDRERFQLWHKFLGKQGAVLRLEGVEVEKRLTGEWKRHLDNLRAELEREKKSAPPAYGFHHGVTEHEDPIDLPLNKRGNPTDLGDPVPRHFLRCLSSSNAVGLREGSGRLQLAKAIVAHPIAARVMANRVWAWLFGAGVVRTPSNFGRMGERPANPALLDYLAASFRDNGFSVKKLIREIVLSETYLASSSSNPSGERLDPDNRLFWRANRQRLDAEAIRDSLLSVSGELDETQFGESAALTDTNLRRTVYVRVGRYQQEETLALFDFPSASVHAEQRAVTNVPLQRLFFLNSEFIKLRARALANRIECAAQSRQQRVAAAYRLALQRDPTKAEQSDALAFLDDGSWPALAQILLSTNEFLYVD